MRTMIFHSDKGKGWYLSCRNWKDPEDKCYVDLFFPQDSAPIFEPNAEGWASLLVDIQQWKMTSYKKYPGMTVFAYEVISNADAEQDPRGFRTKAETEPNPNIHFEETELPFY